MINAINYLLYSSISIQFTPTPLLNISNVSKCVKHRFPYIVRQVHVSMYTVSQKKDYDKSHKM